MGFESTHEANMISGAVYYNNPSTPYEYAVNELSHYVPVYETTIPNNDKGNVIGQTQFNQFGQPNKVLIEQKDPGVLYHEMYHVITPGGGTEQAADKYAASRGYPIHDSTYK